MESGRGESKERILFLQGYAICNFMRQSELGLREPLAAVRTRPAIDSYKGTNSNVEKYFCSLGLFDLPFRNCHSSLFIFKNISIPRL